MRRSPNSRVVDGSGRRPRAIAAGRGGLSTLARLIREAPGPAGRRPRGRGHPLELGLRGGYAGGALVGRLGAPGAPM